MSPFAYMLIGHLVGDYLFQTKWMAVHKAARVSALLIHSTIYTFFVFLASLWGGVGVGLFGFVFIWGSHVFLDQRAFVSWWSDTVMQNKDPEAAWLHIAADQIFHVLVLAVVLHFHF